jgi:hypothetical protein
VRRGEQRRSWRRTLVVDAESEAREFAVNDSARAAVDKARQQADRRSQADQQRARREKGVHGCHQCHAYPTRTITSRMISM